MAKKITNRRDLNQAVANIMCPEPPASERRAPFRAWHASRLIALCLAVCAAFGVELEFAEGWDLR